jgi:hypothetical protein
MESINLYFYIEKLVGRFDKTEYARITLEVAARRPLTRSWEQ